MILYQNKINTKTYALSLALFTCVDLMYFIFFVYACHLPMLALSATEMPYNEQYKLISPNMEAAHSKAWTFISTFQLCKC